MNADNKFTVALTEVDRDDANRVGSNNASMGELIPHLRETRIRVPGGLATWYGTSWHFPERNGLKARRRDRLGEADSGTAGARG